MSNVVCLSSPFLQSEMVHVGHDAMPRSMNSSSEEEPNLVPIYDVEETKVELYFNALYKK